MTPSTNPHTLIGLINGYPQNINEEQLVVPIEESRNQPQAIRIVEDGKPFSLSHCVFIITMQLLVCVVVYIYRSIVVNSFTHSQLVHMVSVVMVMVPSTILVISATQEENFSPDTSMVTLQKEMSFRTFVEHLV